MVQNINVGGCVLIIQMHYRVTMEVMHLRWVDSDLGSSHGRWAVAAAICCPTGGWNILNLSQPNAGAGTTMVILYREYCISDKLALALLAWQLKSSQSDLVTKHLLKSVRIMIHSLWYIRATLLEPLNIL